MRTRRPSAPISGGHGSPVSARWPGDGAGERIVGTGEHDQEAFAERLILVPAVPG
jgi:hypothetical protein